MADGRRRCNRCGEEKSLADFYSKDWSCKPCTKPTRAAYYKVHAKEIKERTLKWRAAHPEKVKQYQHLNYVRHKSRWLGKKRIRTAKDKATNLSYQKKFPERYAAANARRYARKLNATPSWANSFFIEEAYDLAKRRTKMFRFVWHVDHIVPLRGKTVCGLHVENNLRVIPAIQNQKKNNRTWPDMP